MADPGFDKEVPNAHVLHSEKNPVDPFLHLQS